MKSIIGVLMVVTGIVLGLWAGVVWAFVGGIVDIINEIKADDINALAMAIGVVKIVFASLIGWVCAIVLMFPGFVLLGAKPRIRHRRK